MIDSRTPQAVVIAGPNGAGKTSAAPELLHGTVGIDAFVNADVIAEGLAGFRPELAVSRVRHRVESGGHAVPEMVVRRRFWRSLANFDRLYRPAVRAWRLYDGSVLGGRPLIAYGAQAGAPVIADEKRWTEIRKRIEELA